MDKRYNKAKGCYLALHGADVYGVALGWPPPARPSCALHATVPIASYAVDIKGATQGGGGHVHRATAVLLSQLKGASSIAPPIHVPAKNHIWCHCP